MFHRFYNICRNIFLKERLDWDLDQEVRSYLDLLTEEKLRSGMSRADALRQARQELGGVDELKDKVRDVRIGVSIETFLQDLSYGFRLLLRSPGFSLIEVLTLALGIGSTAVLFSILDGAYIHYAPTPQGNRVVLLRQRFTKDKSELGSFSAPEYLDIALRNRCSEELSQNGARHELFFPWLGGARPTPRAFHGFFAIHHLNATLAEDVARPETPERVPVVRATCNIFSLYGISPILGRVFTKEEDKPGGPSVALVTYRLWNGRFNRSPALVGKTIKLDGVPFTVVGIMPRRFQQWGADIYTPLALDTASTNRSNRTLKVAGYERGRAGEAR